uniref:Uncharacterized protein n=1 Tax=Anguilla anguilla TaxID=7936 RepID=A0A0E9TJQ1_ANGAN
MRAYGRLQVICFNKDQKRLCVLITHKLT